MKRILVGHKLVDKAEAFGHKKAKEFERQTARKFSKGGMSYEKRKSLYTNSRLSEIAVCVMLKLDPIQTLKWTAGPDGGIDLEVDGVTIDVKASDHPAARRLIWPVKMIDKLPTAANIFVWSRVLLSMREPLGQVVQLIGCIERDTFIRMKQEAYGLSGIVDGSPYMHEKELDDIDFLPQHIRNFNET